MRTCKCTCVFICMYSCAYACVLLILRPWVRRGPFIHARSPKCCLKAISMNHSTTIAHCQFGPLGYAGFLGFHFCISPPCPSSAAAENNRNKKQIAAMATLSPLPEPARVRVACLPQRSSFSCIRTRLRLWLAGCELSAR